MKYFILFLLIPILFTGCNENNGSDTGISRSYANSLFEPKPDSVCPTDDFINLGARGSN